MSSVAARSPSDLAYALLGHDHWSTPRRILDAVFRPRARIAVKACHSSSKTFSAADCVILTLLAGGDVLTTAPTWEQVRTVLWGEIHRGLYRLQSRVDIGAWDINQTEIRTPSGARAVGLSTNEGVRFQGYHARPGLPLLLVLDEAPGVLPEIYEAIDGISAGGDVRQLLLGNPVVPSGRFYDLFATPLPGWTLLTIDAFDTPNLAGLTLEALLELPEHELDVNPRPYLVDRRWVRDRYHEWGVDHPLWQSRVRGQFPTNADNALIPLSWLEQAARETSERDGVPVHVGIDVAGPGEDETVVCVRQGGRVLELRAFSSPDSRGDVLACLRPWRHRGIERVNVDAIGQGWYFAQHLRDDGLPVREVNVGEASSETDDHGTPKYANLKAEYYWHLRELFRDGEIAGLTDRVARAQLGGLLYKHDPKGKVVIESKDDMRKRGAKSPDRAEAIMLAFAPDDIRDRIGEAFAANAIRPPDPAMQNYYGERPFREVVTPRGLR